VFGDFSHLAIAGFLILVWLSRLLFLCYFLELAYMFSNLVPRLLFECYLLLECLGHYRLMRLAAEG
jgi:hypothetical protein